MHSKRHHGRRKKKAVLFTLMGRATYKLLRNLTAPETVDGISYSDIVDALSRHYCPQPSEIVKRCEFNRCSTQWASPFQLT